MFTDFWQCVLTDVGFAGPDKGKGGKYLLLPPGFTDKVPDGYIALPSLTYQNYALLRSILEGQTAADIAKAVVYAQRISVDIYFGPKAPAGKESNWIPTKAGGKWEVAFRF
jgi:hypothetical protein